MTKQRKLLCIALVLCGLLAAGVSVLWASGTWLYPVPSGTGAQSVGDLVYFADTSHLTNLSSTASGKVLCSTGAGVPPAWCSNPALTGATLTSPLISNGTATGTWTLASSPYSTLAAVGPGAGGGISLYARPSNKAIGACKLVAVAGNAFGPGQEVVIVDPIPGGPGGGCNNS